MPEGRGGPSPGYVEVVAAGETLPVLLLPHAKQAGGRINPDMINTNVDVQLLARIRLISPLSPISQY